MYPFPAPNDDYDCTTCKSKVGAIFQELLKPKAQEVFVAEIQRDLNCETDPDMTDDILCSDNAHKIVLFLGQEVGFSPAEANNVCEEMEGACQKDWTKASCVDDVTDILYPRLIDSDNHERLLKMAIEKYPEAHLLLEYLGDTEDEAQWEKDMAMLVETLGQIYGNIGPGFLCGLVGKVLD